MGSIWNRAVREFKHYLLSDCLCHYFRKALNVEEDASSIMGSKGLSVQLHLGRLVKRFLIFATDWRPIEVAPPWLLYLSLRDVSKRDSYDTNQVIKHHLACPYLQMKELRFGRDLGTYLQQFIPLWVCRPNL